MGWTAAEASAIATVTRSASRSSFPASLAAKLGKPQSYVSKCEQGERRVDVVEFLELAAALDVDPAALTAELL